MLKFLFLKRSCLVVILLQIAGYSLNAQKLYYNERPEFLRANSVWAFGDGGGLDFNNGGPTEFTSLMAANEGCASVADPITGKLLFYSNGGQAWNANHDVMPNGDSLFGNSMNVGGKDASFYSTIQGVCIVPVINDPDKWYLFSLRGPSSGGPMPEGTLFYNIIDMNLNNGLGDIVTGKKNIALDSSLLTEAMIAIPGDNCDVWLMVHGQNRDFRAYHITKDGIDMTPVISNSIGGLDVYVGSMAISPDRSKIAFTDFLGGGISIAEFNPLSGLVTDEAVVKQGLATVYAVCFSPDNSKLYANSQHGVYQFDLTVYNAQAIANSFTAVSNLRFNCSGLKLYNDTIYYLKGKNMSRINQPNLLGNACNVQELAILEVQSAAVSRAINNDVVLPLFLDTVYSIALDSVICKNDFMINASEGFTTYRWENGSTSSERIITMPGTYWVLSKDFCNTRVDTFIISGMDLIHPIINVDERKLGTVASYESYQWLRSGNIIPGATDSIYMANGNGDYQVIVSSKAGCIDTSDVYEVTDAKDPNYIEDVNVLADRIHIFPNPTNGIIGISAPVAVSIEVYTIEGRLMKQAKNVEKISIAHFSNGLYFLKIYDSMGRLLKYEKVIKK